METSNENLINLQQYKEKYIPKIELALREFLPPSPANCEAGFNSAIEIAVFSERNSLCSILTLIGAELFGGNPDQILPAAVAVEYISASSKTFQDVQNDNDLPTRDIRSSNDGLSTLVGLSLLNAAYPLVFVNHLGMPDRAMQAHREIVECVGASGLIGALANKRKQAQADSSAQLQDSLVINYPDNSAMIRLALRLGAILAGADYLDLANMTRVAETIGQACQMSNLGGDNGDFSFADGQIETRLNNLVDEAKRLLIENFPSNEARSCLIQLVESLPTD